MNNEILWGPIVRNSYTQKLIHALKWSSVLKDKNGSPTFPFANIAVPNENLIVLEFALSGYDRENLQVLFNELELIVQYNDRCFRTFAPATEDQMEERYLVHNIKEGGFMRPFTLGQGMHPRKAFFIDGILTVWVEVETSDIITSRRKGTVEILNEKPVYFKQPQPEELRLEEI